MADKLLIVYGLAALLGLFVGVVGSWFLVAIKGVSSLLENGLIAANADGWPVALLSALASMTMVYGAWLLVRLYDPEASGSGIQEIEGVLWHERPIFWRRLLPVKFLGGILSVSSNLVLGREGPTIQMGGNLGAMLSEWFRLSGPRCESMIAAGAAAGLATAFNAPLAGILFVLEELKGVFKFSFTNFSSVSVCCVAAVIVRDLMLGSAPALAMPIFNLPSLRSLLLFFVFGILVGFVGLLFNRMLMKSLHYVDQLSVLWRDLYVVLIGFVLGYIAYVWPSVMGGGYSIIESAFEMNFSFLMLCVLIMVRFLTTMLSYNTGVPGGIFAPMLALGTLVGLASSHILQWLMLDITVHPAMFAVAGMGGLFAAVVRAPLTGIVLVVEMTQNYALILPLMVTCLTATTVVQLTGCQPIYTQLLHRSVKNSAHSFQKSVV